MATANSFHEDRILHFFTKRYGQAHSNEVLAFIDAVTTGKQLNPNGFDGLHVQKLADAATLPCQTGKPVKVS